jgi:hypothetical protein
MLLPRVIVSVPATAPDVPFPVVGNGGVPDDVIVIPVDVDVAPAVPATTTSPETPSSNPSTAQLSLKSARDNGPPL